MFSATIKKYSKVSLILKISTNEPVSRKTGFIVSSIFVKISIILEVLKSNLTTKEGAEKLV